MTDEPTQEEEHTSPIDEAFAVLEEQLPGIPSVEHSREARLRLIKIAAGMSSGLLPAKYPVQHQNDLITTRGVTLELAPPDGPYARGATSDSVLAAAVVLMEHEARDERSP